MCTTRRETLKFFRGSHLINLEFFRGTYQNYQAGGLIFLNLVSSRATVEAGIPGGSIFLRLEFLTGSCF